MGVVGLPWRLLGWTAGIALMTMPSAAQGPELAMLGSLEKGSWELRQRGSDGRQQLCVRTGREFIQLRHRQAGCNQVIVQDDAEEVTVQYTCPGSGYGRTTIRQEAAGLVQIRSQGLLDASPFAFEGEARRVGSC